MHYNVLQNGGCLPLLVVPSKGTFFKLDINGNSLFFHYHDGAKRKKASVITAGNRVNFQSDMMPRISLLLNFFKDMTDAQIEDYLKTLV